MELTPVKSLGVGLVFHIILFLSLLGFAAFQGHVGFLPTVLALIMTGGLFRFQVKRVELVHGGVLTVLGRRVNVRVTEGFHFVPFLCGIEEQDIHEKEFAVDKKTFAVGRIETVNNRPIYMGAEFTISARVIAVVEDVSQLFNVRPEDINDRVRYGLLGALRDMGTHFTPDEFLRLAEDRIQKYVITVLTRNTKWDPDYFKRVGLRIANVIINQIEFTDPTLRRAYELLKKELREQIGEEVAVKHLAHSIAVIMDATDCSYEQAMTAFWRATNQTGNNDIAIHMSGGEGGSNNPLAAIVAGAQIIAGKGKNNDQK